MARKFRLYVRLWVKQDPLYNSSMDAHSAGLKTSKPEDIHVKVESV